MSKFGYRQYMVHTSLMQAYISNYLLVLLSGLSIKSHYQAGERRQKTYMRMWFETGVAARYPWTGRLVDSGPGIARGGVPLWCNLHILNKFCWILD